MYRIQPAEPSLASAVLANQILSEGTIVVIYTFCVQKLDCTFGEILLYAGFCQISWKLFICIILSYSLSYRHPH